MPINTKLHFTKAEFNNIWLANYFEIYISILVKQITTDNGKG